MKMTATDIEEKAVPKGTAFSVSIENVL